MRYNLVSKAKTSRQSIVLIVYLNCQASRRCPVPPTQFVRLWCKSKLSPNWYNLLRSNSVQAPPAHPERRSNLTAFISLWSSWLSNWYTHTGRLSVESSYLKLLPLTRNYYKRTDEGTVWLVRTNLSMNQRANDQRKTCRYVSPVGCRLRPPFINLQPFPIAVDCIWRHYTNPARPS